MEKLAKNEAKFKSLVERFSKIKILKVSELFTFWL